ncbi:hypothetical protein K432DRAFT_391167 [Lepidopterella palustris CBS 459.81]|uniref:WD40 repeat-like protein n=1 Tax=Lepidopterella palustris CBS 459.81 TaxID=1314670 RepID=A0A8E2EEV6_9PEZI|nr:hypothetical protein K432DRAFT_391167 [Lepidopterella palustris CBS 459.81]
MANQFRFPNDYHLIIVTHSAILSWWKRGVVPIFQSGCEGGILAAKEARDGSGLLAIADSQVVILHDARRRMDRDYRLKGTDGSIRLVEYSSDSQTLFFTTSLQTAAQSYSLRHGHLQERAQPHPSPPTVLAASKSKASNLLLSASHSPPTIFIQDYSTRTQNPPLQLQPSASASPVACASFHPTLTTTFLLGFVDGTLASYKITDNPTYIYGRTRPQQAIELGQFLKLHKAAMGGIKAAEFIPGYKSRAVSAGRDGKVKLVDFQRGGVVLRTWMINGPATCLSVLPPRKELLGIRTGKSDSRTVDTLIAIGKKDGKVLLFNSLGLLVDERQVGKAVIGIDFLEGNHKPPLTAPMPSKPPPPLSLAPTPPRHSSSDSDYSPAELSTVKRVVPRTPTNAIAAMGIHDLFSPSRSSSIKPSPSHAPRLHRTANRRKRPHTRPRILTSTFHTPPTSPPQPTSSANSNFRTPLSSLKSPTPRFANPGSPTPNSPTPTSPSPSKFMTPPTSPTPPSPHVEFAPTATTTEHGSGRQDVRLEILVRGDRERRKPVVLNERMKAKLENLRGGSKH